MSCGHGGLREDKGCWTGADLAPVTRPSTPELASQAERLVAILEPGPDTQKIKVG